MGELFNIQMETDESEWTSKTVGAGQSLARSTSAGQEGSVAGARLVMATQNAAYFKKSFTAIATTDFRFKVAFSDFAALTMATGNTYEAARVRNLGDVGTKFWLEVNDNSGTTRVRTGMFDDNSSTVNGSYVNWPGSPPAWVELHCHKATGASNNDGYLDLYFEDTLVDHKTGLDIYTSFNFDTLLVGGVAGIDAGTSGTLDFDNVVANDDGSAIGSLVPPTTAPVADAGADEVGTFGTPVNKTDMGGSDVDTDIISALLESAEGTLITVNVGGSGATVTDNGTDSVLIEGDQTQVLAALADVDFSFADPGWDSPWSTPPVVSVAEVITLTLTDSGALEDVDTFTLSWAKAAGDDTVSIVTSGLTLAQLNAWLQAVLYDPITDSLDAQAAYLEVTSDSPATDSKIVPIAIQDIANTPPIADAGPDQAVLVGVAVQLDGSGSNDADGDALTYLWTIVQAPEGSTAAFSDATLINPTITPDLPGVYLLALFVNDGTETSDGDQIQLTVSLSPEDAPLVADALDATFFPKSRVPLVKGDKRQTDGTVVPSLDLVWKYPKDLYDIAVDWSGKHVLPGGATAAAAVDVTITDPSLGSPNDVTSTILSSEAVDALVSIGTVQSGTIGKAYTVRHRTTFDNGRFLNKYVTLQIHNPRSAPHQLFKYPDEEFDVPLLWTGRAPRGATAFGALVVKAYDASDVDVTDDYIVLIDGDSGKAVGTLSEKGFSVARITGGVGGEQILLEFAQSFDNLRTFHEYALLTVRIPPA